MTGHIYGQGPNSRVSRVACVQGDQIERFFTNWVIVTLGSFLIAEVAQHFKSTFSTVKLCFYIDKIKLGYILGDFFSD
jgi:hypothetical protein